MLSVDTHAVHFRVLSGRLRWAPEKRSREPRRPHAEHVSWEGGRGGGGALAGGRGQGLRLGAGLGSGQSRRLHVGIRRVSAGGS